MAVIASSVSSHVSCHMNQRKHVPVYDMRAPCIDRLRTAIVYSDWSAVYHTDDVTEMYGLFSWQCKDIIENCVPVKMVRIGPRDPDFITLLIITRHEKHA